MIAHDRRRANLLPLVQLPCIPGQQPQPATHASDLLVVNEGAIAFNRMLKTQPHGPPKSVPNDNRVMASILAGMQDPAPATTASTSSATPPTTTDPINSEEEDNKEEPEDNYVAPMDRTIAPSDATEIVDNMTSLYHVGTSNIKITYLGGLAQLAPTLTELSLRSNLVRSLKGIELLSNLTTIELADNRIRKMGPMNLSTTCPSLTNLDLSYNQIRRIENISGLIHLKHLYVANNKLTTIGMEEGLGSLPTNLKRLDLGYNRIRHMENIPLSLEELWLGKNKITIVKGLSKMDGSLRILDIQSNRLVSLVQGSVPAAKKREQEQGQEQGQEQEQEGTNDGNTGEEKTPSTTDHHTEATAMPHQKVCTATRDDEEPDMIGLRHSCLSNVQELYLSHQGIATMEGLESLTSLHTLDLSSNKIETLHNMSTLVKLEECWMNDNQIETFDSVKQELVPLDASLRTVYLERNPVADEFLYRKTLASLLPSLTQIDASRIPNRKR